MSDNLICGICCYKNKQPTDFASTKHGVCSDCGKKTTVYIFTDSVIASQSRQREKGDYMAYVTNLIKASQ